MPNRCTGTTARVLRRQRPLDGFGADAEGLGIDVAEDRPRADRRHRLGGGVEGERGHDHLVARLHAERAQSDRQRVGAVRDPDHVLDAEVLGELRLESVHLGAEDEPGRLHHLQQAPVELRAQLGDQLGRVEQRDRHHGDATLSGAGSRAQAARGRLPCPSHARC